MRMTVGDSGRRHEHAEPRALVLVVRRRASRASAALEVAPRSAAAPPLRGARRALGIVEVEDRRLRDEVGPAEARRVRLVALDLRRAAFVATRRRGRARRRGAGGPSRSATGRRGSRPPASSRTGRSSRRGGGSPRRRRAAKVAAIAPSRPRRLSEQRFVARRRVDVALGELRGVERRSSERAGIGDARYRVGALAHRWHPQQFSGGFERAAAGRRGLRASTPCS